MRAVLASALLARLRQMTDTVNDTHLTDAWLYQVLTSAVSNTWDAILAAGSVGEFVKKQNFSSVAGQKEYLLTGTGKIITDDDFYKIETVYVDEGSGQLRPINRINPMEEQAYRAPNTVVPMVLYYVPCAPVWTLGTESFDGINGWEEHTLAVAAMVIMGKKQDDQAPFVKLKRDMEARISTMANKSQGEPARVVRKRRQASLDRYASWQNNVSCYDYRGGKLELFYRWGYTL